MRMHFFKPEFLLNLHRNFLTLIGQFGLFFYQKKQFSGHRHSWALKTPQKAGSAAFFPTTLIVSLHVVGKKMSFRGDSN